MSAVSLPQSIESTSTARARRPQTVLATELSKLKHRQAEDKRKRRRAGVNNALQQAQQSNPTPQLPLVAVAATGEADDGEQENEDGRGSAAIGGLARHGDFQAPDEATQRGVIDLLTTLFYKEVPPTRRMRTFAKAVIAAYCIVSPPPGLHIDVPTGELEFERRVWALAKKLNLFYDDSSEDEHGVNGLVGGEDAIATDPNVQRGMDINEKATKILEICAILDPICQEFNTVQLHFAAAAIEASPRFINGEYMVDADFFSEAIIRFANAIDSYEIDHMTADELDAGRVAAGQLLDSTAFTEFSSEPQTQNITEDSGFGEEIEIGEEMRKDETLDAKANEAVIKEVLALLLDEVQIMEANAEEAIIREVIGSLLAETERKETEKVKDSSQMMIRKRKISENAEPIKKRRLDLENVAPRSFHAFLYSETEPTLDTFLRHLQSLGLLSDAKSDDFICERIISNDVRRFVYRVDFTAKANLLSNLNALLQSPNRREAMEETTLFAYNMTKQEVVSTVFLMIFKKMKASDTPHSNWSIDECKLVMEGGRKLSLTEVLQEYPESAYNAYQALNRPTKKIMRTVPGFEKLPRSRGDEVPKESTSDPDAIHPNSSEC